MNKILSGFTIFSIMVSVFGYSVPKNAIAVADEDQILPVSLTVGSTISIDCSNTVTMNAITGTGQSAITNANRATCTVITNNSGGYKLEWTASTTAMVGVGNVANTIAAYSPAGASPETWSVAASDSEWGGKLGFAGENGPYNSATWGTADTYADGKFFNVGTGAYELFSTTTQTDLDGFVDYIYFGAEVGASKTQPTDEYRVNVTLTATTL